MKKFILTTVIIAVFITLAFSQELTQTVRGTIIDTDNKLPLIGTTVMILDSDPLIGTATDADGKFRLENVPIGRITLQLSYLGYESKTIPNIVVNSGKEVILNLNLQESVVNLDEVVIRSKRQNGEALNEMSLISARSVSTEQTKRYAGTFNDPSRILSNFAGVTSTQDGSSDIIVRGNSPKYMQWRLEGIEISSPYHFDDQNSSFGGLVALNNNLLATSDFYTGAFSPEFGDVLSCVYDVKLRPGNNEKFESSFGFGLIGTDLTVEGPFKKNYAGSYLLNYRYSTATLIQNLGLIDVNGLFNFQDLTAKIVLPTKKAGIFSFFSLGGLNNFSTEDINADMLQTVGDRSMRAEIVEDYYKNNFLLNSGVNHTFFINSKSYIKTTLSYSTAGMKDDVFESRIEEKYDDHGEVILDTINRTLNYTSKLNNSVYRGAITYSNKLNAKNKIQIGTKYALFDYDNDQSMLLDDLTTRFTLVDFNGNVSTLRNFVSWKHRLNDNITLVTGFHNMNVLLNKKYTLEPRVAFNWKLNSTNSIHGGYGNHSNMERIHNYFAKILQEDGSVIEPNKDLDLLKAHHFVLGYQKRFNENVMGKVEVYYQHLYNLPVENNDTSYYATINEGLEYRYVDLVNKGTGRNYGIEVTLERYFNNNYYYLINASLYGSKYKSLEGIERNTQYNGNYLLNILCGKEFENLGKKDNQTLALNAKIFFGGGRKIIPLLRDEDGNLAIDSENNKFWDHKKAYDTKIEDVYQITLSVSYKINRPKATHEIFLDMQNITGFKPRINEYYDEDEPNSIGYLTFPVGLFPNLMYRIYF